MHRLLFALLLIVNTSAYCEEEILDLNPHSADGKVVLSYPVSRSVYMAQQSWIPGEEKCPLSVEKASEIALSWIKKRHPDLSLWIYQVDLRGDLFEKHKWHYSVSFRGFPREIKLGKDITEIIILFDGTIVEPKVP